jgi:hypothetical protein
MPETQSYYLEKEQIEYIKTTAQRNGGTSVSAALRFILDEHREMAARRERKKEIEYKMTLPYAVEHSIDALTRGEEPLYLSEIADHLNDKWGTQESPFKLTVQVVARYVREIGYEVFRDGDGRSYLEPLELSKAMRRIART